MNCLGLSFDYPDKRHHHPGHPSACVNEKPLQHRESRKALNALQQRLSDKPTLFCGIEYREIVVVRQEKIFLSSHISVRVFVVILSPASPCSGKGYFHRFLGSVNCF
jgi:hypothetical protein